jgi:hypothetical protein
MLPPFVTSSEFQLDMLEEVQLDVEDRPSDNAFNDPLPLNVTALVLLESSTTPQPVVVRWEFPLMFSVVPVVPPMHTQVVLNVPPPAVAVAEIV